jgi:putative transposase
LCYNSRCEAHCTTEAQPTPFQADTLLHTLEAANAACNSISTLAWQTRTFGKFALQKACYEQIREQFGLAAQMTIRALAKVADAYKLDKKVKRQFRPHAAIAYDDRILSFALPKSEVSLWTLNGRQAISFVCGERQRRLLATRQGESDLLFQRGQWYLLVTCEIEEAEPKDVDDVLGVDLGIVNLATDSDSESHSGEQVERKRQWYARRRAALQAVGTKSAKRRLRQLSGRQRRFQKDVNHRISKRLVAKAERTKRAIAVEELSGIRQRARARGPEQRARHSNWAFGQLRQFISYKARRAGVAVIAVEARNTSRTCPVCGHCEKANRRSQAEFCCVVCQHQAPADVNAAVNIRQRAAVIQPMVSSLRAEAQAARL